MVTSGPSRELDTAGAVIATVDDYAAVYELVARLMADAAGRSVPAAVRDTVTAVSEASGWSGGATIQAVAEALERDRTTASRNLKRAVGMGYVEPVSGPEVKKAKLFKLGEPLPEDVGVLPDPDEIRGA